MKFKNEEYNINTWNNENLGKLITLDTETTMVNSHQVPDLVTVQVTNGDSNVYYIELPDLALFLNKHYDSSFIMHNASFDVDVINKHLGRDVWRDHYDRCMVYDTSVLYRLLHLATAGFIPFKWNLQLLTEKFLGVNIPKDERRENFGQFLGVTLDVIPSEFLEYGANDVIATHQLYHILRGHIRKHDKKAELLSHHIQVKGELALKHINRNGIGFDLAMKDEWLSKKNIELDYLSQRLSDWGWMRGMKGIKDRYEQIIQWLGLSEAIPFKFKDEEVIEQDGKWFTKEEGMPLEEGKKGTRSSSREDLVLYKNRQFIGDYLDYIELEKATTFVRDVHSSRLHPRYNSLVNTGRTSCSSPNFQQLPRMGGIREMFKADEGNTLIITDYSAIELATLSQVLLNRYGYTKMGERINEGEDLHRYYASVLYSKPIMEVTKDERQSAKAANFGFPGGLGLATFTTFARSYGLDITEKEAQVMKDAWFEAFPEMRRYLQEEMGYVYTLTGRKRGNTTYCAEKNTPFQGLAADGAKLALYNLDKAGFKVVGFVHDEIICEVPVNDAALYCGQQEKIMIESMNKVVPDIKISVESQISERYCK